jgi:hypothetical protein
MYFQTLHAPVRKFSDSPTATVVPAHLLQLARQIVETMNCLNMGSFRSLLNIPNIQMGASAKAVPYLQKGAADALERAAAAAGGVIINSAIRTVPQQLLIWMKLQRKQCGFKAAARPGSFPRIADRDFVFLCFVKF